MKSKELADNVLVVWETLGSSRADDFAKPPVGFEQLTHQGLASIFEGWIEKIGALEKARWLTPDEIAVADHVIARRLADLPNLISTSTQHGLSWLYSTNFLELVADVNAQINGLTSRTARAGREALRSLQRDVITDLADVARAADEAQEVVTMAREMRGIRDAMVSASTSATTAADSAIRIAQQSDGVRVQISEAEAFIAARRQEIERLYAEATTSRDSADAKASQLEQRIGSLAIDVENATKQVAEAREKLSIAMRDARKEGLAGAFSQRASNLMNEQIVWGLVFAASVIALAIFAIKFATDLTNFTYEELVVALLRRVALAAPPIWLGWYAAKQLGRVNKIKEDYEFKSATALAFQSHESAVDASNSPELTAELLKRVIANFGDNPTRLFDDHAKEPVTPTEALLKAIEKDPALKLAERIKALIK